MDRGLFLFTILGEDSVNIMDSVDLTEEEFNKLVLRVELKVGLPIQKIIHILEATPLAEA